MSKVTTSKLQSKLNRFIRGIGQALSKPERRCLAELTVGLCKIRQPILRQLALALRESIPLKKTIRRFRRHLRKADWGQRLWEGVQARLGARLHSHDYVAVDLSDLQKPQAPSLEGLDWVRDGDTGQVGPGFYWLNLMGVSADGTSLFPLMSRLYSFTRQAVSENTELLEAIEQTGQYLPDDICWLLDRGADRTVLFERLIEADREFIIRLKHNRRLTIGASSQSVANWAKQLDRPFRCGCWVSKKNKRVRREYEGGARRVSLPQAQPDSQGQAQLWLVCLKAEHGGESYFLVRTSLSDADRIVRHTVTGYGHRWSIEEYHRHLKEQFNLEAIQVQKWNHLQNLISVIGVAMAWLYGELDRWHMRLLTDSPVPILPGKSIWEVLGFRMYKIAEVVRLFLEGSTVRMFHPDGLARPDPPGGLTLQFES